MKKLPYVLQNTQWKNVKDKNWEVAVLPWGATEPHNYHLPYGTDTLETDFIAAESARIAWEQGAKVMVLPTIPFGVNSGQINLPFCINMNPGTQIKVLKDIVEALVIQGIKKLLILNGHGGNEFRHMIRELKVKQPEIFISTLDWYKTLDNSKYFDEPGDHAGEMETSIMLHIKPDLCLPIQEAGYGKAGNINLTGIKEGWVWAPREWRKISKDTGVGDPSKATAEKGKHFLTDLTQKIASFLVELDKSDTDDLYEHN